MPDELRAITVVPCRCILLAVCKMQGADVKYIDPSYIIRTSPTISNDRIYCKVLAHNAVHAAFAGYTGVMVGPLPPWPPSAQASCTSLAPLSAQLATSCRA